MWGLGVSVRERSQLFSSAHRRALSRNRVIAADRVRAGHRIDHFAWIPGSASSRARMPGSPAAACRANEAGAKQTSRPAGRRASIAGAGGLGKALTLGRKPARSQAATIRSK